MDMTKRRGMAAVLVLAALALVAVNVLGAPGGASISDNSTETASTVAPDGHSAARSTITTMVLDSTQQDQHWKAYVGNVTGALSLDDADGNTIYDWALATISGEVYASRSNSLDFSTVECANTSTISSENDFNNMTATQVDNVNGTFNATAHQEVVVAGTTIGADTCASQALFVNDARQVPSSTADFQELLLQENTDSLVYATIINDDTTGFDSQNYDFQMIVGESDLKSTPTTYYFYLELG